MISLGRTNIKTASPAEPAFALFDVIHQTCAIKCKSWATNFPAGRWQYVRLNNSISGLGVSALMWLTFHFGVLQLIGECTTLPHRWSGVNSEVENVFMCTPRSAAGSDNVKLECDGKSQEANTNLVPLTFIYMSRLKTSIFMGTPCIKCWLAREG